jgi:alkylhydroperoxidase/carboxymuconolactone decarboxylase family protein YurZ
VGIRLQLEEVVENRPRLVKVHADDALREGLVDEELVEACHVVGSYDRMFSLRREGKGKEEEKGEVEGRM